MPRMSSLVQTPSRSGCPHAVRGAFQLGSLAFAAVISAGIARNADGFIVGPKPRPPPSPLPPARPPAGAAAAAAGAAGARSCAATEIWGRFDATPTVAVQASRDQKTL